MEERATAEGGTEAPFWFFPLIPGGGVHLVNRKGPQPKLDEIFSNEPGRKKRGEDGEFEDDEEVDNEEVEVVVDSSASILWIKDCRDCTLRIELTHHLDKIVFENLARCEFYFSANQGGGCDYLEVADYCQELFVSFEEDLVIPLVTVDNGDIINFVFPQSWGPASGKNCMFITAGSTALLVQIKDAPKRHKVPRGDHDITLQAVVTRDDEAEDRSLFRSAELLMAGCASARERLAFIARKVYLHENAGHSEEEEMARASATGDEGEATRMAHRQALIQSGATDLLAQLLAKDDLEKGSKRSGHGSEEELKEYFDPPEVLNAKVQALAKLMKESKYGVAYTGAGVSTSADIPDYRGPQGVWTLKDRGEASSGGLKDLKSACPTPTHMALTGMLKNGYMRHIASTNLDGLHRRSGLERKDLSELHGNCFVEKCRECGVIYERDEDIGGDSLDHLTGNDCEDEDCMGALVDNIINFGEFTERPILDKARYHGTHADLTLVLGTSMKVTAACYMPLEVLSKRDPDAENGSGQTPRSQGKMVIVNLQKTPFDHLAAIRIFAKCDEVIQLLAKELGIQVPEHQPKQK